MEIRNGKLERWEFSSPIGDLGSAFPALRSLQKLGPQDNGLNLSREPAVAQVCVFIILGHIALPFPKNQSLSRSPSCEPKAL